MFSKFYDETYNLRTISTRRLWVNALLFPCLIMLGIFLVADTYEPQRALESRGVVVDAVVVQHEAGCNWSSRVSGATRHAT